MKPSSEVGKASGEGMGIEETMEGVVTTVEAMASVVEAVEAMVTAVEMLEWLEVGRPETERTTAVHFFSRALAGQKQENYIQWFRGYTPPLYWPGLLPGLVQLLLDCLPPHNSKAIQSNAMLSLKYLLCLSRNHRHRHALVEEIGSHASDHLLRLVREADCAQIRNQAIWLLGRMASPTFMHPVQPNIDVLNLLPLLTDIVRQSAAILEPTDTEISSLNTALKALKQVLEQFRSVLVNSQDLWAPHIMEMVPDLVGIFQEPGKGKKAQIRVSQCLAMMASRMDGDGAFFLDSGVIGMLVEAVRAGKEPTPVLVNALYALAEFLYYNDQVVRGAILDMGALGVFHLVLKRPNDRFKPRRYSASLWNGAISCLERSVESVWGSAGGADLSGEKVEAILNQEGLVELILERALGMDMSKTEGYHGCTLRLLYEMTKQCSESQMRRLMLKGPLFRLLNHCLNCYLNWEAFDKEFMLLLTVRFCLAKCPEAHQRILRRLIDSSGLPDNIRRISLADPSHFLYPFVKDLACNILDTYLTNPLPPPPPNNLPAIIYTRNVPL